MEASEVLENSAGYMICVYVMYLWSLAVTHHLFPLYE